MFETKPRLFILGLVHDLLGMVTVIGTIRGAVVVVGLSENENVVTTSERILENGGRSEVYIGIVAGGLVR